jgi:hypothetical protein
MLFLLLILQGFIIKSLEIEQVFYIMCMVPVVLVLGGGFGTCLLND